MRALVTGGGGFLGRRVVELLRAQGDEVRTFQRGRYPEVEATGAVAFQGDLLDKEAVRAAVDGVDTVFHVASMTGFWEKRGQRAFWRANVDGTNNLLAAMEDAGVRRLVYTSTPSVVGYAGDVQNGAQDLPYAKRHRSPYPASKAAAEAEVLRANGPQLATVSLRPHLIFGPRDNNLLPRILQRAAAGKLPIIGDGRARVDATYIDNAAWAHLDAASALTDAGAPCAGKAYFIGNEDPVVLVEWLNELLEGVGIAPLSRKIPHGLAGLVAGALELAWDNLPLRGEPRLTPFVVDGFARHHWYDPEPARRDLGYTPRVEMDQAVERTVAWFLEQGY
ncbi:MAG: NAD-dependent epimerase/dehydratase family protein [Deltaproteobacteria bacterium]|nr:NAD-dependent epimerase/dehydratase family protein [Deltaproteobacteria bacterium]